MSQKVALITGASKGIGAACAAKLASEGFRIALHYRSNPEEAQRVASEIPGAELFRYDLSNESACQDLVKEVVAKMGGLDVLVNNAGVALDQMLTFAKIDDFNTSIATNLRPVFLLSKFASKSMIRKKSGAIINITSVVGHTGNLGQGIYAAHRASSWTCGCADRAGRTKRSSLVSGSDRF